MANHEAVIDLMNDNAQLTHTVDLLEKNAGIQARLLADTARQRDAMDKLLAEAADYLNSHRGMDGMDLGNKITQFRLTLQKQSGADVGSVQASGGDHG